jgi:predicted small secreted protein
MRKIVGVVLLGLCVLTTACNTVRGAGRDVKSVGRVFSKHPNGPDESTDRTYR